MEFSKIYNRGEFLNFLRRDFLPDDFSQVNEPVVFATKPTYSKQATKLGVCKSLDLVVYEIKHSGKDDPRVGLSKEAFRMLSEEWQSRALVLFVPETNANNYRFSLIKIKLEGDQTSAKVHRKYSNPRRYSYLLGEGIGGYTPNKYLAKGKIRENDEKDLLERFSVEVLTKEFYAELSDWYAWAIGNVTFPGEEGETEEKRVEHRSKNVIRLLTRLLFVWFLKQKHLIPWELFDEEYLSNNVLKDFSPNLRSFAEKSQESRYYKAILQNLFFATLNCPIVPQSAEDQRERGFRKSDWYGQGFGQDHLMRYEALFSNPTKFLELVNQRVPFLNGGLFDCLDDKQNKVYIDGFSDNLIKPNQLIVPDFLFFGEMQGKGQDLSEFYGDKKKKSSDVNGLIDILKRHNFTIEENMPFDQEVSLDPELLGKVFENLLASYNPETKTTARKQTGSFYTPREIVQYMVGESLVAHLKRTVGEDLEEEYRKLMRYTDEETTIDDDKRLAIIQSLQNCKVLDPACGSGAFPIGVLQQMVHILSQLDPNNEVWKNLILDESVKELGTTLRDCTVEERNEIQEDINRNFDDSINRPDYARKLYLIEKCIYGVDIQSIAVQISKLRFFISLVVDQNPTLDRTDNFGIRPLPNLEAKFVAANTLIGLKKENSLSLSYTEEIKAKEKELREAQHKIFGAKTSKTKRKYKDVAKTLRVEISEILNGLGAIDSDEAGNLASWDMFDQNTHSPFFDPEWMFGVSNGFDIVIGNPPYIQLQANGGYLAEQLKGANYETFTRMGDIYCVFYERGMQILRDGGIETFITSSKWMKAAYGDKTRAYFAKFNPLILIELGANIFESATVDTNILILQKSENTDHLLASKIDSVVNLNRIEFTTLSNLNNEIWTISAAEQQSIKAKIAKYGTPLKKWDLQIFRGVLTGYNEAFIIDSSKKEQLVAEDINNEKLMIPILRGRDIQKYAADWAGLWLINTHNGVKGKFDRIDISDFPILKSHLETHWDKVARRADQGDTPYNLRNCAYLESFKEPKIVWKRIGSILRFCYDETGGAVLDSTCFATGNGVKYLVAVLNSKMGHYLLQDAPKTGTGDLLISVQALEPICIPKLSESEQQPFIALVDQILEAKRLDPTADTTALEIQIDQMVYVLYNLTPDEIAIIEK